MNNRTRTDVLLLIAFCGFLYFWGLDSFGLVGADEPRYAQVAREMLERHDWVTPTLHGKPWLEKPVLYYWQAMLAYSALGISDRAARLPGAIDAALLIAAVYLFLRRFRPGSETDGALITASCAAMIGFSRAAATDMPLAATFGIALLGWYAWYESGKRIYLACFYLFLALGTLAKGPVAPCLAAAILLVFAALKEDWRVLLRTLWIPGIVLFLAVALPWYVAVQSRNPEFFRVFILEHNLARFSRDIYHHRQPFWFYVPVILASLLPWALWVIVCAAERLRAFWAERRNGHTSDEDAWPVFLMIWLFLPVVFFSASQSKLPGYILPAVPAGALLVPEYLAIRWKGNRKMSPWLAGAHAIVCGALVFGAIAAASILMNHKFVWNGETEVAAGLAAAVTLGVAAALLSPAGLRFFRLATLVPIVLGVAAILRLAAPVLDAKLSARPIVRTIQSFSQEKVAIAVFHTNREQEYGLEWYLNRAVEHYELNQIPREGHVVVAAQNSDTQLQELLRGRKLSRLTSVPLQKLDLFWVSGTEK